MKKKRVGLIAVLLLAALLALFLLSAGQKQSDIALVRGIEPYSSELGPMYVKFPTLLIRQYSLQMPYDDAVKAVKKEMSARGWICDPPCYERATFRSPKSNDFVMIMRQRHFDPVQTPIVHMGMKSFRVDPPKPLPDPHGWVTVTTSKRIGVPTGVLMKAQRWVAHRGKTDNFPTGAIQPNPKVGGGAQLVDVEKGSMDMESSNNNYSYSIGSK